MRQSSLSSFSGFTLIEVLVSMVVLAVGLLGIGALQTVAIRDSQEAYLYSEAVTLAYEMADRIHANANVWNGSTLPAAAASCSNNCNSAAHTCNAPTMAAYDYCVWNIKARTQLGEAASATVSISPVPGSSVCSGDVSMRCLTLNWVNAYQGSAKFELELQP